MLYENLKKEIEKSKSIGKNSGASKMSMIMVRPFDVVYHEKRYPVLMVRVDNSGNRLYAIPNDEVVDPPEAVKWIQERWLTEIIPSNDKG